jgi:single-strand DNA-binding protein
MEAYMNKVFLIGHLGKNPEAKSGKIGFTCFSLATTKSWKKDNNKVEKTTWHNCIAFGKTGELISKYCNKGSRVFLECEIDNYQYEKDGEKRYGTQLIVRNVQFLMQKESRSTPQNEKNVPQKKFEDNSAFGGTDFGLGDEQAPFGFE